MDIVSCTAIPIVVNPPLLLCCILSYLICGPSVTGIRLTIDCTAASSTPTSTLTWISWFCSLPGHEYFCEVTEDFIEDDFNLTGLNTMVPFWKEAMEMVLDVEPGVDEDTSKIPDVSIVESSAEMLYGLVHQRYILTRVGLQAMAEKYESGVFGSCPRVYCVGCNVVPCGRVDIPGNDTVKLFCPNCNDIFVPPSSRFQGVDGAFFGTTFAHLFFQTYRELAPAPFWKAPSAGGSPLSPRSVSGSNGSRTSPFVNPNPHGGQKRAAGYVYVPRIYGFKVSERAKSGPRMQWLRLRPESPEELDMVDWRGRWINEDDEYDDEEEEDEDRQMEDFDPDVVEGEDDDEEEEEEEEEEAGGGAPMTGQKPGKQAASDSIPPPSSPVHSARTSPTSSGAPRSPDDKPLIDLSVYTLPPFRQASGKGKVRMVRQWAPRADWAGTAQV
ncbi:casein kinase II regulatory subunit-domain-containing protein [Flammula alnicola]|nr:casein kinase II regulatory subunit-domain-containing protein [Flammula alnicola]